MANTPLRLCAIICFALVASACSNPRAFYIVGSPQRQRELGLLFERLDTENLSGQERVTIIEQVAGYLVSAGYPERMRVFLTTYVDQHPKDAYSAYYLLLVAKSYAETSPELAEHYYRRIVWTRADVIIRGVSAHYTALTELIQLSEEPTQRIAYYDDLLERFGDAVDLGTVYYAIADAYGKLGQWDDAFSSYRRFLDYCDIAEDGCNSVIDGRLNAYQTIGARVRFYDSDKDWTRADLNSLVSDIKRALVNQNSNGLLHYRAGENFFARSWEQDEFDFNSQISFNLGIFLRRSQVRFADEIDITSNVREAYLRTWGWSHRISTWYLYFRRVDFPADPEIHGNWEWAGIFFGERYDPRAGCVSAVAYSSAYCSLPAFVYRAGRSAGPQQVDMTVARHIDWEEGSLTLSISAPIARASRNRAGAFHSIQQQIQSELPRLFPQVLLDMPIDSNDNADMRIADDRSLLGRIIGIASSGSKIRTRQTVDLRHVEVDYRWRLFPDIGGLFVGHSRPVPVPRRIGLTPGDAFSGIVIYAAEPLPVRGESRRALARPTLFPTIYDSELRPILRPEMLDPATLRQGGVVAYSSSLDPDDWQSRVGLNPLRITATELFGRFAADLVVADEDAERILSREHNRTLLRNGRIIIIVAAEHIRESATL